jgi:hypothetical protein
MADRLRLYAADADDLAVISALMQDAAVVARDIGYDGKARRLVILANRFRWENRSRTRVRTAIRLEGVSRLERRRWPDVPGTVLDLLALRIENGRLGIDFAGGPALRAEAECVDVEMHDLSEPWPTRAVPRHEL